MYSAVLPPSLMLFFILISYFCIKCLILQFHLDKGIIAFNRGDPAEGEQFCRKKKSRRRQRPHPTPSTINSANKTLLTINPRPNVLPSSDCSQFYFLLRTKTPPPARASPPILELPVLFPASCHWQLTVFLSSSLILYFAHWEFINWDCFVGCPLERLAEYPVYPFYDLNELLHFSFNFWFPAKIGGQLPNWLSNGLGWANWAKWGVRILNRIEL